MRKRESSQFYPLLAACALSLLLVLPTLAKFVHDSLEHHTHELCADELEGEVHYHPMEVTCHFHPVYISPYSQSQIMLVPGYGLEEPQYIQVVPKAVCTDLQAVVTLRGPPAV